MHNLKTLFGAFPFLCGTLMLVPCYSLIAQADTGEGHRLAIRQAVSGIQMDGVLDEAAWQSAEIAGNFFQNFPFDTSLAERQTEVRMTFDQHFLYIGAVLHQPQADYIVTSLKRDFSQDANDLFAVDLDPFQDKLNGFHFAVSPLNVQREGLIDNGNSITTDWDNKWYSQVGNHPDHWVVEIAIPFKTLRYKRSNGDNIWRVNFTRNAVRQNERSCWVPVPRQFDPDNLAFTGLLVWEDTPPQPGLNLALIPYLTGNTQRDHEFMLPGEQEANAGLDAKIGLTPSLNLDLTFNPDFSQVEVDRQITNLSRFELFFPERRQFFLENEDLFSRFGFPDSRPFFSRRIGLASGIVRRRATDGQLIEVPRTLNVPILAGVRLSGKLNNNWRVGLLNMQTGKVRDLNLNPANYAVGVLQRKVFERSTIGAVLVNKENFRPRSDGGYQLDRGAYNRVVGLEYNLYSKDNKWEAEFFYHRSFHAGRQRDAQAAAAFLGYNTRRWGIFWANQYIGSDHVAETGFVPRAGNLYVLPGVNYTIFPRSPGLARRIIQITLGLFNEIIYNNPDLRLTDRRHTASVSLQFPGQSELSLSASKEYIYLFFPFDPTNSGGQALPEGSDYTFNSFQLGFNSDVRRKVFFEVQARRGAYFNGHLSNLEGSFSFRWQPYGLLALSYAYNDIRLPKPYNSTDFWLVGPRAELSFSRSLFFSIFLQYNTQANNVNINSRLQWRFKPVSDLFLVYTDNYFSDQFFRSPLVKNRALVLKATYWLNI